MKINTLNKIIPQPQKSNSVLRNVIEGEADINPDFRRQGCATFDFNGEDNTTALKNDTGNITSAQRIPDGFYAPSIGELATGMQQIQKVNNTLLILNSISGGTDLVDLNEVYGSTTFYGSNQGKEYTKKTTNGVWVYDSIFGCIMPRNIKGNYKLLKFYKYINTEFNYQDVNNDDNNQNTDISSATYEIKTNNGNNPPIFMKEVDGSWVESSNDGYAIAKVTLNNPNAFVSNIYWYTNSNSDAFEFRRSDGQIQNYYDLDKGDSSVSLQIEIHPKIIEKSAGIYFIINEGLENVFDSRVNISNIINLKITKEATLSPSIDLSIENNISLLEKDETARIIVNKKNGYNGSLNWNITKQSGDDNGLEITSSNSGECFIKAKQINNDSTYIIQATDTEDITITASISIIVKKYESTITLNIDDLLWYFRYSDVGIDNEDFYNKPFDDINKTHKIFKLPIIDNDKLVVFPHKTNITNLDNENIHLSSYLKSKYWNGTCDFDIYLVLKNDSGINLNNITSFIVNYTNLNNNIEIPIIDEDGELEEFYRYHVEETDGYVVWKISFKDIRLPWLSNGKDFKISIISNNITYTKTYKLYGWDMYVYQSFAGLYFRMLDSTVGYTYFGRIFNYLQRLYNTNSHGCLGGGDNEINYFEHKLFNIFPIDPNNDYIQSASILVAETQQIEYGLNGSEEITENLTGLSPTYNKDNPANGELLPILYSKDQYTPINYTDTNTPALYLYLLPILEYNGDDEYQLNIGTNVSNNSFLSTSVNKVLPVIRIFFSKDQGVYGLDEEAYFINCSDIKNYETNMNVHISNIPIGGIRQVLTLIPYYGSMGPNDWIEQVFIYNNSNNTKKIILNDYTNTITDYFNTPVITLEPHRFIYLKLTKYCYFADPGTIRTYPLNYKLLNIQLDNPTSDALLINQDITYGYTPDFINLYKNSTNHIVSESDFNGVMNNLPDYNSNYLDSNNYTVYNTFMPQIIELIDRPSVTYESTVVHIFVHFYISDQNFNNLNINNISNITLQLNISSPGYENYINDSINIDISTQINTSQNLLGKVFANMGQGLEMRYNPSTPYFDVYLHHIEFEYFDSNYLNHQYRLPEEDQDVINLDAYKWNYHTGTILSSYYSGINEYYCNYNGWKSRLRNYNSDKTLEICITIPIEGLIRATNGDGGTINCDRLYIARADAPNSSISEMY